MPQTCSWLLTSVKMSLGSGRSPRQRSWAKARSWTRPRWSPTCPSSTSCSGGRPCLPRVVDFLLWGCPVSFACCQYLTGPFRWESLVQINIIEKTKKCREKPVMNWRHWWFFLGIFSTTLPQSSSSSQTCSRTINVISLQHLAFLTSICHK